MDADVDLRGPWRAIVRAPMVRIALPFIAGIALAAWRMPGLHGVLLALLLATPPALLVLLFPAERLARWQRGSVVSFWFLCFGLLWQVIRQPVADPRHVVHHADHEGPWAVRVEAVNGTSAKAFRADARLIGQLRDTLLLPRKGRVMLTLLLTEETPIPRRGDRLLVEAPLAAIARVPDPGGFDRRAWAASRGIAMELFAPTKAWRAVDHQPRWTDAFSSTRDRVSNWLNGSDLPMRERAVVKALVLGQRDELDSEQREAFARSGTIHVLAVSGMHVGLIFAILTFLFGWWGKSDRARLWRGVFILLALWGYAGLTGASPSVMRATVMFSLFTLAGMGAQRTDHLNSLFAAAMLLLLYDPALLGVIGFQLSFLAVLGIIVFYKPIERLWSPTGRVWRAVWSMAVVSIAAQLLTTPLSLYLFKAFPVWFLPANIIVVTAVGLAVNGAVILLFIYKVPLIGPAITWAMTTLLKIVGAVTAFFAALPGAYPEVRVGPWSVALLYVLLLSLAAWWQWRWRGMRWVAGASLAGLLVIWAVQARTIRDRASFTVYDERGPLLASMVQGRDLVLHAADPAALSEARIERKVERHQRTFGTALVALTDPLITGAEAPILAGPTIAGAGRWRSPAFEVAFANRSLWPTPLPGGQRYQALVIHDMDRIAQADMEEITALAEQLVLAGDLPFRLRLKLRQWAESEGLRVHDVRDEGAFVLTRGRGYSSSM